MQAGDLFYKISIQHDTSDGTTDPMWVTFATVWANKKGLAGRVFYQAAAVQSESDIIYTIRWQQGFTTGMRILDDTSILRIKAPPIDVDGRRKWLEIHAEEVLINGG